MTFFAPGKPYLDSDPQPPLSPLVMQQQQNSHYGYGLGMGQQTSVTTLRRIPSSAGGGSKKTRAPPENKPSLLLNPEENLLVFGVLGKGRQTLSTAVVQLLYPTPGNGWKLRDVGVLCFVRDSNRRSYFLDVISLRMNRVIFSQEIYDEFVYRQPNLRMRFLTFEGDEFMVGLSFASAEELREFRATLDNKMNAKRRRQIERQRSLYDQATYATLPMASPTKKTPTITSANMHSMLTGLAAPISPYATARPAPASPPLPPMSPTTKFNTVSGSSPLAKAMAASGAGRGGGGASSFGTSTLRAQQSPYAAAHANGGGGIGIGMVPMSPISIPKIQTSQVSAGPPGSPNVVPASEPIVSSITLSRPPMGKKPGRFGGRRNSTAAAYANNNANANKKGVPVKKEKEAKVKGKKDKKEKLTKSDIGLPMNFVHVQHAGFDSQKGFTNKVLDERYKALFDKVGISASELQDDSTRKFIYEFIDQYEQDHAKVRGAPAHGPSVKEQPDDWPSPPAPGPFQPQAQNQRRAPTPVAPVNPPPVPARAAEKKQAPAPPPPTSQPQPLQQPSQHQTSRYNGQQTSFPTPLPPPMPGQNNGHVPQASAPSPQQPRRLAAPLPQQAQRQGQGRSGSAAPPPPPMPVPMQTNLDDEEEPGEAYHASSATSVSAPAAPEGGRVNLLKEIQAGISLRKVEDHKLAPGGEGGGSLVSAESMDGLAGALARALAERSRAIHSDSSSEEDGDGGVASDDSDEWK